MKQSLLILASILLGTFWTAGADLTFLLRYVLMVMIFFACLDIQFSRSHLRWWHLNVLVLNLVLPLAWFDLLHTIEPRFATAVFIIALAPTAAAAPVIAQLLRTRVDLVVVSIFVTMPVVALLAPFLLALIGAETGGVDAWTVLRRSLEIVVIPLVPVFGLRRFFPAAVRALASWKWISPYLFCFNVWIASGNASRFLQTQTALTGLDLFWLFLWIGAVAVVNFGLGWLLDRTERHPGSLALGRKNTMFVLWLALTYLDPLAALGPMFYILWQNLINSIQIAQKKPRPDPELNRDRGAVGRGKESPMGDR